MLYAAEVELTLLPCWESDGKGNGRSKTIDRFLPLLLSQKIFMKERGYYNSVTETLPLDSRTTLVRRSIGLGQNEPLPREPRWVSAERQNAFAQS